MTKIRHIITTTHGTRYLTGLGDGINTSIDPLEAISNGLAWVSPEIAVAKFKEVRELHPAIDWGLALVTLTGQPGNPLHWQASSVQAFNITEDQNG